MTSSVSFTQTSGFGCSAEFCVKVSAEEKGAMRGTIPVGGGLGISSNPAG